MAKPKAKTLQELFGFLDEDLKLPTHDQMIKWLDANIEDVLMIVFNLQTRPKVVRTKWEPVVRLKSRDGLLVGFVDFMAVNWCPSELEGYRDSFGRCSVLFEAKTELESLGILFRQVRMYQEGFVDREAVSGMPFVILCPDDSEAETIRQQCLHFFEIRPCDEV